MSKIPDKHKDLLDKAIFAHLACINEDGTPQNTPVWFKWDGQHVIVNTAKGRKKDRNLKRNPNVALSMTDPENGYRYLEVRGKVVKHSEEGADDVIDSLAKKYLGKDKYPFRQPGEVRVTYWIEPTHCTSMG